MNRNLRFDFEVDFPSGFVFYGDSLGKCFLAEEDKRLMSSDITEMLVILDTVKLGCASGFVGSTDPYILRSKVKENSFLIASSGKRSAVFPLGVRVGRITTNLWRYSLVDSKVYDLCKGEKKYPQGQFEVKPGVYLFTHYLSATDHDLDNEPYRLHAEAVWVRGSPASK